MFLTGQCLNQSWCLGLVGAGLHWPVLRVCSLAGLEVRVTSPGTTWVKKVGRSNSPKRAWKLTYQREGRDLGKANTKLHNRWHLGHVRVPEFWLYDAPKPHSPASFLMTHLFLLFTRLLTRKKILNPLPSRGSLCPPVLASDLVPTHRKERKWTSSEGPMSGPLSTWTGRFHHSSHSPGGPHRDVSVTVLCYVMSDGNRMRREHKLTGKLQQSAYLDATLAE